MKPIEIDTAPGVASDRQPNAVKRPALWEFCDSDDVDDAVNVRGEWQNANTRMALYLSTDSKDNLRISLIDSGSRPKAFVARKARP